ncbi:MAG: OmpA family protein [Deltaproteobacteria bacterium]|nr:OmpA family protein [Deltaproteobacteria bacterium]
MARLTPLAKGLLTVTIIAVSGAAAWHLGLKDYASKAGFLGGAPGDSAASSGSGASGPGIAPGVEGGGATGAQSGPVGLSGTKGPGQGNASASGSSSRAGAAFGSSSDPLKVSIVSFHGYAPALVANGQSLKTKPGSIFDKKGLAVEFVIQDDIPTLATIFTSKVAHCAWRTSDFWAQEQPNLRNAGLDGRAIMVVDNTQGADAVIARDPAIKRVEDLAGRSIALLQYTPSHGMVLDAIENSSLSSRKKTSVKYVYINADEGTAGVRAAFESGQVDAAALWDPDLSLALRKVAGAHVVYSTKTATNLIYDVIVCDKALLDDPARAPAFQKLVDGWFEGVVAAEANPDSAVEALVKTEEFFSLLAKDEGRDFVKSLFGSLVWTGLEDNARILGLSGGTNHYARVYRQFDQIYRAAGALANPNSPVINPEDSFDDRFVRALIRANPKAEQEAKVPEFSFTAEGRERAAQEAATLTKPVTVNFSSGSSELTKRAQKTIDEDMVPLIENNGSAYFEVSGNTDSTGSRATNMRLSEARANRVVDYLVAQWEFPRDRFRIVGNGPDKPLCNERDPKGDGLSLADCRAMNRTTRLAILARR